VDPKEPKPDKKFRKPSMSLWITAQDIERQYGFGKANSILSGSFSARIRSAKVGGRRLFLRADCEAFHRELLQQATRDRALRRGELDEAFRLNNRTEKASIESEIEIDAQIEASHEQDGKAYDNE
jgi:hypothetical protein